MQFYEHESLSERLFSASDNASFVRKGIPAHSISAGSLHEDYHQPGDEVDKIDIANMTLVIRGIFYAGAVMADGGPVPRWDPESRYAR